MSHPGEKTELRQLTPADTLSAIDAIAQSESMTRTDYINRLLEEHAKVRLHKANVLMRMTRGNPLLSDALGG